MVVTAYLAGKNTGDAGAVIGASDEFVRRELMSRGIPLRKPRDLRYARSVDPTRFVAMDTEAEAYWLGFLMTDGCITNHPPAVKIGLSAADADHLRAFLRFVGSDKDLYFRQPKGTSLVPNSGRKAEANVYSVELVANLARVGMHPNKTWTVRPWEGPAELMRHYWRGCFDGDGCFDSGVRKNRGKTAEWYATYTGNEQMVTGFSAFIAANTGRPGVFWQKPAVGKASAAEGKLIWSVRWGGNGSVGKIASLLYDGATVSLDRKRVLAEEVTTLPDLFPHRKLTVEDLLAARAAAATWEHARRALGVSFGTFWRLRRRLLPGLE